MSKTFLVAVDGSETAHAAFVTAVDMMNRAKDILFVMTMAQGSVIDDRVEYPAEVRHAQDVLDKYARLMKESGVANTGMIYGKGTHAGEAIVSAADRKEVDVIVVGRRGLSPVRRLLLGSTSQYVARHATCHVLLVRKPSVAEMHDSLGAVKEAEEEERARREVEAKVFVEHANIDVVHMLEDEERARREFGGPAAVHDSLINVKEAEEKERARRTDGISEMHINRRIVIAEEERERMRRIAEQHTDTPISVHLHR